MRRVLSRVGLIQKEEIPCLEAQELCHNPHMEAKVCKRSGWRGINKSSFHSTATSKSHTHSSTKPAYGSSVSAKKGSKSKKRVSNKAGTQLVLDIGGVN